MLHVLVECEKEDETAKVFEVCQHIEFEDTTRHGNFDKVLPHNPVAIQVEHDEFSHVLVHKIRHSDEQWQNNEANADSYEVHEKDEAS